MADRVAAVVAFVAAVALVALGVMLGSVASGNGAPTDLVIVAGTAASVGVLIVLTYAFAKIGRAMPWAQVGQGLTIAGVTLLLMGDAVSADAARQAGNALLYVAFIVLGVVAWESHLKLAAFAVINGIIGFAFMAFADALGLPPQANFMLIAIWLVAIGIDWLRAPWPVASAPVGEPSAA